MASTPQFSDTLVFHHVTINTANTNVDGTGEVSTLMVGQGTGTRIELFRIYCPGTVTNGKVRFFLDNGQGWKPLFERLVTGTTPGATTKGFTDEFEPTRKRFSYLPPGMKIGVSTLNSETIHVMAEGSYAKASEAGA